MAAPAVLSRATSVSSTTDATSFTPTLPTVTVGKLLLAVVSADGAPVLTTSSTGWRKVGQDSNTTVVTGAVFFKRAATGSDALVVTSSASEQFSAVTFCIDAGAEPALASAFANGSSINSNPPEVIAWAAHDLLVIAARAGDAAVVATAAPASYGNLQSRAAGGANGASTNTAERAVTAASFEDPGTFTSATEQWVCASIAIWSDVAALSAWEAKRDHATDLARILVLGDSMAAGADDDGLGGNRLAVAWPAVLADTLQAAPGVWTNFVGDGGAYAAGQTASDYDPRRTLGGTWGRSDLDGALTIGGAAFRATASGGSLSFAPGLAFDRARVWFSAYAGSPQNTVNVDGGASLGTLAQNVADSVSSATFSVSDGVHTLNIVSGGAYAYILGVETWRSTVKQVQVINAGWWGQSAVGYMAWVNPLDPPAAVLAMQPDLGINALGGNDMINVEAEGAFRRAYEMACLMLKVAGSAMCVIVPYNPGIPQIQHDRIGGYISDVAAATNCHLLDLRNAWGGAAAAQSAGYMSADNLHLSTTGEAALAELVRQAVDSAPAPVVVGGAGTSAGTSTAAATGGKIAAGSGASTGAATASSTGGKLAPGAGSAAGAGAATGSGGSLQAGSGTAAGAATSQGAGGSVAAGAGTSAGSSTTTGQGSVQIPGGSTKAGAGSSVAASTAQAQGVVLSTGAGAAAGSATTSAGGGKVAGGAGSATGGSTATGEAPTVGVVSGAGSSAGAAGAEAGGGKIAAGAGAAAGSGQASSGLTDVDEAPNSRVLIVEAEQRLLVIGFENRTCEVT